MPDLSPELTLLGIVVAFVCVIALAIPLARTNGADADDDEPICWPDAPDYRGDAAFFERRRRLEKQQRRARRLRTWKYWL